MKNKGVKIAIIILIGISIIVGGCIVFLLMKGDIFLSNQKSFYKYVNQENTVINNLMTYYEAQNINSNSFNLNGRLNVESNSDDYDFDAGINVIKKDKDFEGSINIQENDEELTFKFLKIDEKFGILFPGIKQYVVIENDNLKEFANKFELEDYEELIPNKVSYTALKEVFQLTSEEKSEIKEVCLKILNENISDEKYKMEKNFPINFNGENITTTGYTISLNKKDILNITTGLLNEVKSNETILNLIENKIDYFLWSEEVDLFTLFFRVSIVSYYESINNLYAIAGSEKNNNFVDELKIDREEIIKAIDEAIDNIQNEGNESEDIEDNEENLEEDNLNIKVSVYEKSGKLLRIECSIEKEEQVVSYYTKDDENEKNLIKYVFLIDNIKNENNISEIQLKEEIFLNGEIDDGKTTLLTIENLDNKTTLKEEIKSCEGKTIAQIEDTIERKDDVINTIYKLNLQDSEDENLSFQLENSSEITITDDIKISNEFEDNEVILNALTSEKIEKVFSAISEKVQEEIKKVFPDYDGGNMNILNKAEEAVKSNTEAMMIDSIRMAYSEMWIDWPEKKYSKDEMLNKDNFKLYMEKFYNGNIEIEGNLIDGNGKYTFYDDENDIKQNVYFEDYIMSFKED